MILYIGQAIFYIHKCTDKKLEMRGHSSNVHSYPLNLHKLSYLLHMIAKLTRQSIKGGTILLPYTYWRIKMISDAGRWADGAQELLLGCNPVLSYSIPSIPKEWWVCCSRESNQWMQTSQAVEHYDHHICLTRSSIMRSGVAPSI